MTPQLQNSVFSPQDLKAITSDVGKYAQWFGQNAVKSRVAAAKPAPQPAISETAATLINDLAKDKPLNAESLDGLITTLDNLANTLPSMTITLAAPAPATLKKTMVAWCRQNISPDILVEFRFNSTLLGGMVIRYGSHVYDWSFRRQILAARNKFPEALRRV